MDGQVVKEIQNEVGPEFDYSQNVNGFGVLMCRMTDKTTGFYVRGNTVHFGADPKQEARKARDLLLNARKEYVK